MKTQEKMLRVIVFSWNRDYYADKKEQTKSALLLGQPHSDEQIGRIFASWAIILYRLLFENFRSCQNI
jgi:hypothetical protein